MWKIPKFNLMYRNGYVYRFPIESGMTFLRYMSFPRKRKSNVLTYIMLIILFTGCGGGDNITGPDPPDIGNNNPNVYVAIGNSITEAGFALSGSPYPARLSSMTGETVVNEGHGGETSGAGAARVTGALAQYKPAGLLILFGANDVIFRINTATIIANLRAIIQAAKANQTRPIIANLTPMYDSHAAFQGGVNELNPLIQQLASEEGADFVDLASAFGNNRSLMQADGLHPTDEGNQIIASEFAKFVI